MDPGHLGENAVTQIKSAALPCRVECDVSH